MSANMTCGACGSHGWPQMSLNAKGKLQPSCQNCGQELHDANLEDFQVGKPVDAERHQLPDVAIAPPPPPRMISPPTVTPGERERLPLAASGAPAPVPAPQRMDVIGAVRERLAYLESEDARLEGVIADSRARLAGIHVEAKKLRKMLAAADRVSAVSVGFYSPTSESLHQ